MCAIGRGPWAKPYYDWKLRFFGALPSKTKARITYRRYPYDDFFRLANLTWNDEAMMAGLVDDCPLDDHTAAPREAIAASGLVLTDQFSSSFMEAMTLDRPTVLLLHDAAVFSAAYAPLMQGMLACGMVQNDAEAAADFVARLLEAGPEAWWNSEEVRQVRQQVLRTFVGEPERAIELLLALARGEGGMA